MDNLQAKYISDKFFSEKLVNDKLTIKHSNVIIELDCEISEIGTLLEKIEIQQQSFFDRMEIHTYFCDFDAYANQQE
ncbi:hypothetical protein A9Q99_03010 [Gammaproteobacteria bacterium 45_16_T64]|nr:hypothetical protein A9Q99_03010 [Gammaproteobacteria bacterium 45_16_T64]